MAVEDRLADQLLPLRLRVERRHLRDDLSAWRHLRVADVVRHTAGRIVVFLRRVRQAAIQVALLALLLLGGVPDVTRRDAEGKYIKYKEVTAGADPLP